MASANTHIDWDRIPLLSETDLLDELAKSEWPQLAEFLRTYSAKESDTPRRSKLVDNWLSWCRQQRNTVKVVEADIPAGIMPKRVNGSLSDIKVS